jgi:hypothetical protein
VGDLRCRKPARFVTRVSRAVSELRVRSPSPEELDQHFRKLDARNHDETKTQDHGGSHLCPGHCRVARCAGYCDPIRTLRTPHPGTNASPAVGTGTRIGLAIGRTKPGRRRLVKAGREPIAEGGTRRRQIVLARHLVHLRHPRYFDLGRWRWRRWRRQIDLRTARQKYLRERRICGENRADHTGNDE